MALTRDCVDFVHHLTGVVVTYSHKICHLRRGTRRGGGVPREDSNEKEESFYVILYLPPLTQEVP